MSNVKVGSELLLEGLRFIDAAVRHFEQQDASIDVGTRIYAVLLYLESIYCEVDALVNKPLHPKKKASPAKVKKPEPKVVAKAPVKKPVAKVAKVAQKVVKKVEVKKATTKVVVKKLPAKPVAKKVVKKPVKSAKAK